MRILKGSDARKGGRGLTRRQFLGLSLGGAALVGAPLALSASGILNPSKAQAGYRPRLAPVSSYAQSLINVVCPDGLASTVESLRTLEMPQSCSTFKDAIPRVEAPASAESLEVFASRVAKVKPDFLVDVGYAGTDLVDASVLERLSGVPVVSISLDDMPFSRALTVLAERVRVEAPEAAIAVLGEIDALLSRAQAVEEGNRPCVLVGFDVDGFTVPGESTSAWRAVENAAGVPCDVGGGTGFKCVDEMAIAEKYDLNLVFLANGDAYEDYCDGGIQTAGWNILGVGKAGRVYSGCASESVWLEDMSGFAQVSLGAAWLAGALYPECASHGFDELAQRYYSALFGTEAVVDARFAQWPDAQEDGGIPSKAELDAEQQGIRDDLSEAMDRGFEAMREEAARQPTEEELQALLDGFQSTPEEVLEAARYA